VDEFKDATDIVADRNAMRSRLRDEGCLFFRRLVDAREVLAVREEVLSALDSAGWLDANADRGEARPDDKVRFEGSDDFWGGYAGIQSGTRFHRLAHDPSLVRMLRALVDDDLLVHPRKIARVSYPKAGFTTPPHQDFRYIQGTTDTFTVWMPLGPCPVELGGLRVLRGSQDSGLLPTIKAHGAGGLAVEVADDDPDWATIDYQPGDAIVFHSLTVHGAIPNQSDRLRLSVDYRYQSQHEPIASPSLRPHFHPTLPDWPALTQTWASTELVDAPHDLTLTGFGPPPGDLALPPSRFVRVPV
jgi:hypothetical protein